MLDDLAETDGAAYKEIQEAAADHMVRHTVRKMCYLLCRWTLRTQFHKRNTSTAAVQRSTREIMNV